MHIDKLGDTVIEFNDTCHRTIKLKPVEVKSRIYIDFGIKKKKNDPKLDHVRILKYKNIFSKVYTPNWSEEVFVIK